MIRFLITGAGHPIAEGTLASLRTAGEEEFHIVGVDIPERGRSFPWVDSHYVVPPSSSSEFLPSLLDVCRKEEIDVIAPWSDDEVEIVSWAVDDLKKLGTVALCSPPRSLERTLDKGTLLEELAKSDIPAPRYALVSEADDLEAAAEELGYPERRVVLKPRRGTCSRGLWVLDREVDLVNPYPGPGQQVSLEALKSLLYHIEEEGKPLPDYVAMEFLPGQDYSVDALADSGQALFVLPRKRLKTEGGISQVGEFVGNREVREMVARVIGEFQLHLNVNLQLKYSEAAGGTPLLYEINPRISGTVGANDAAGVPLLYLGIQLALGRPIPPPEPLRAQEGRMTRSWIPRFTPGPGSFIP